MLDNSYQVCIGGYDYIGDRIGMVNNIIEKVIAITVFALGFCLLLSVAGVS